MRKYLFVINPNAGKKAGRHLMQLITTQLPRQLAHELIVWENKNDFSDIEKLIKQGEHSHVIAVGGDGTVNKVAACVVGTKKILGIVPAGSGNGLARSMGISMDPAKAIFEMAVAKTIQIDAAEVNGQFFFCTSGVGFDARIGHLFASSKRRGLLSYIGITTKELFRYRATEYELEIDKQRIKRKAFLVTVANAGQYGNDFYIAPLAKLSDGQLNVAIFKPFSALAVPGILRKFLRKEAHMSKYIESHRSNEITIYRSQPDSIHFDGEPKHEDKVLHYKVHPSALNIIVGKNYKKETVLDF